MPNRLFFLIALFTGLLTSACSFGDNSNPSTMTETPPLVTPVTTPFAPITPATPTQPPQSTTTLIVWIPPEIAQRTEEGSSILIDQISDFDISRQDVEVLVEYKPATGEGGILSYLRAGQDVAPSILPHLIAIPSDQLASAAAEGLIFPLDDVLPADLLDDLYPAAETMARSGEQTIGYPFAFANLLHLAYNSSIITTTTSITWSGLISDTAHPMIFPGAGAEGAKLALQFYLAAGGTLTNDVGQPALQVEPLTTALEQISQGRSNGFILSQSSNTTSLAESWQTFQTVTAVFTLTSAGQFLHERNASLPVGFAAIPGLNAPLPPLVDGWAWAISTSESVHKPLAAELLVTLMGDSNLGEWSLQNRILPTRRLALARWPADDAYIRFIRQELERAQVTPVNVNSPIMVALSNAVFDVVSLVKSPDVAAAEAVTALQP